jgi:hypothetical protein
MMVVLLRTQEPRVMIESARGSGLLLAQEYDTQRTDRVSRTHAKRAAGAMPAAPAINRRRTAAPPATLT